MKLSERHRYKIAWESSERAPKVIESCNRKLHFSKPVTDKSNLKLYVVSHNGRPIYVGRTTDPIAERLRLGFTAKGEKGYSGYLWRYYLCQATIDIWMLTLEDEDFETMKCDPSMISAADNIERKREILVETLEAEVVLQIRNRYGHWPKYQSEIHFHQSQGIHQRKAQEIVNCFQEPKCPIA